MKTVRAVIDFRDLERLYLQHAPALSLYARQWSGSAEDMVQNAFLRLAQQTSPPERVLPWLYRVVRNEVLATNRMATRQKQRERRCSISEVWFSSTEDQVDAKEATCLLAELTLELREIIIARIWGGLTFNEIAEVFGCSLAIAHRRYRTGITQLRARLEGQ